MKHIGVILWSKNTIVGEGARAVSKDRFSTAQQNLLEGDEEGWVEL